jgi:Na+-transporting NADH:ubiquinone oxidoreductase subunit NqrF
LGLNYLRKLAFRESRKVRIKVRITTPFFVRGIMPNGLFSVAYCNCCDMRKVRIRSPFGERPGSNTRNLRKS